jgi:hypothetical protein
LEETEVTASFLSNDDSTMLASLCERNKKNRFFQTVVSPQFVSTDDMALRCLCDGSQSFEQFAKKQKRCINSSFGHRVGRQCLLMLPATMSCPGVNRTSYRPANN